jgi:hypothetical protein
MPQAVRVVTQENSMVMMPEQPFPVGVKIPDDEYIDRPHD